MYWAASPKTKEVSDRLEYINTHLHQDTWSIHNLRVQNVYTKYRKYFCGFLNSRLLNFARKLMYRKYFHFYSNTFLVLGGIDEDLQTVLFSMILNFFNFVKNLL